MSTLDGKAPPVLGDKDPKGPPDNRPPTKPPTEPKYPPPTKPPTKSAGVMNDLQWPDEVPFPSFRRRKTPKAPKPPKGLRGTCMVGELLVPLFGRSWVDEVTAAGGLAPWLVRRVLRVLFPARSPEAYR